MSESPPACLGRYKRPTPPNDCETCPSEESAICKKVVPRKLILVHINRIEVLLEARSLEPQSLD